MRTGRDLSNNGIYYSTFICVKTMDTFSIYEPERWVFQYFVNLIARRLAMRGITDFYRRPLTRLLYAFQRFPSITPGLSINIYWQEGLGDPRVSARGYTCVLTFTEEELTISLSPARLQYFQGGCHHLIYWSCMPVGEERQHVLENWINEFSALADPDQALIIEDYSKGDMVDVLPLSAQWDARMDCANDLTIL